MSLAAQEAVWADGTDEKIIGPLTPAPGFVGQRTEGGTAVKGEWPYCSGSDRAKWALIGYPMLSPEGVPSLDTGLISLNDVPIKDTWYVAGLAGTSSNTIVVSETFIPDEWQITIPDMVAGRFRTPFAAEPLYRIDTALVFHIATLPPVIGLAKAAFDHTLQRITKSPRVQTYTFYLDTTKAPATQSAMARAGWLVETAMEQACAIADEMDVKAAAGEMFSSQERARHIMRVAQCHRMCREAMDLILDVGGAGSFALVNPVQRMWRDMNVASRHGLSVPGIKEEIFGRSLLGADEQQMTPLR
jgi:alkylation response protein AidB-like acyl-CoA dehydrogenase